LLQLTLIQKSELGNPRVVEDACGGSKWGGKSSDAYVAFTLPGKL